MLGRNGDAIGLLENRLQSDSWPTPARGVLRVLCERTPAQTPRQPRKLATLFLGGPRADTLADLYAEDPRGRLSLRLADRSFYDLDAKQLRLLPFHQDHLISVRLGPRRATMNAYALTRRSNGPSFSRRLFQRGARSTGAT